MGHFSVFENDQYPDTHPLLLRISAVHAAQPDPKAACRMAVPAGLHPGRARGGGAACGGGGAPWCHAGGARLRRPQEQVPLRLYAPPLFTSFLCIQFALFEVT